MRKSVLCSITALILASGTNVFAGATKAVDQLAAQTPKQQNAVLPEARAEDTTVIITEKGQPVRTIFFEIDKGNPIFDAIFGNHGDNNGHNGPHNGGPNDHNGGFGPNPYGRMNCMAQDTGWEEHWGGHGGGPSELRACQECLREHGDCRYNCSVEQFRCTARFNPVQAPVPPGQPQPPLPAPSTYAGDLRPDQGSAQDSAVLRCMQYTQGQPGNCAIADCNRESQVVRSGRCRK
ncbi:MAG TPA: hypothetical protein DCL44_08220 [Elusimicrobia bacterium]|nr:hypothetical protein [Elusimicrobiota bacterium]